MAKKEKLTYSAAQKKAYYSGMGYRVAYNGKVVPFKNEKNKDSFRAGFSAAGKVVKEYPKLKKKN